nr:hypothetical protein [Xanthomonas oryzae]
MSIYAVAVYAEQRDGDAIVYLCDAIEVDGIAWIALNGISEKMLAEPSRTQRRTTWFCAPSTLRYRRVSTMRLRPAALSCFTGWNY